jgi:hypothetical protein
VETLAENYIKKGMPEDGYGQSEPESGYQHFMDVEKFETDGDWSVEFRLADKTVKVSMEGAPGTTVYLVNSYTADKERKRRGLLVRRRTAKTLFKTVYECIGKTEK